VSDGIVFKLPDNIRDNDVQIYEMKSLADHNNDTFVYAIVNKGLNKLYYYDDKFQLSKIISIKKKHQVETFDVIIESLDSIYSIMDDNIIELYIPSKDSSYIIRPDSSTKLFLDSFVGNICSYEFYNKNSKIAKYTYACFLPNLFFERNKRYNNYWGAVLSINPTSYSYRLSNYFLKFPDTYKKNYFFTSYPCMSVANNYIYYAYKNVPIIYKYSILEDETTVHPLQVNGFKNIKSIPFESLPNDIDSIETAHLLTSSSFRSICYDKYKKRFYALHVKPSTLYDKSGLINLITDKEFELLVLDTNLKIINKVSFPKGTYNIPRYYVTPKGIFYRRKDSKKLIYDLFEFK
jgi:hypothetical protein